jgi:hypothetical protein
VLAYVNARIWEQYNQIEMSFVVKLGEYILEILAIFLLKIVKSSDNEDIKQFSNVL